jgi:hypothetical protein
MIDITKKYKTRNGHEVTNLLRLPEPLASGTSYPIFGLLDGELSTWQDDGHVYEDMNDDLDLIEVKEPVKLALVFSKDCKQDYGLFRVLPLGAAHPYEVSEQFKVIEIEAPQFP